MNKYNLDNPGSNDLIIYVKKIFANKNLILKYIISFLFLGIIYSLSVTSTYQSFTTIVPQSQDNQSSLDAIESFTGIDFSSQNESGSISPILFPDLANSEAYKEKLLYTKFYYSKINKEITFKEYLLKYKKISIYEYVTNTLNSIIKFPIRLLRGITNENDITSNKNNQNMISYEDILLMKNKMIDVTVDARKKNISLSFTIDNPEISYKILKLGTKILQEMIIDIKIGKAKEELSFLQSRHDELKLNYELTQKKLADFNDRNKSIGTSISKIDLDNLNSEYNLAYNMYSQISLKLENQKLAVKKNTPIFTVIKPIIYPYERNFPNRKAIVFLFVFLGLTLALFNILFLNEIKKTFNEIKK